MQIHDPRKIKRYLEKYPVHQYFTTDVTPHLQLHIFRKGEHLCEERKTPDYLYFILEGKVKLSLIHQDGNVTLVQYYEPGDILGELELLGMRQQSQAIEAVGEVTCMALPFEGCKDIMLEDTKFLQNLCRLIAGKMQRSVNKLVGIQTYPLENRLADYFIQKEDEVGQDQWMHVKLTDLAQYLGVSYRHLSRVIKDFDDAGWIQKERTKMRVLERKPLEELLRQMEIE